LIDTIVSGSHVNQVILVAIYFMSTILLVQFARFLKRYFVRLFANRTNRSMRTISYHNIISKPIIEAEKEKYGDVMTRLVGDVDITVEGIRKVTTETFDTGVLMASYLVTLFLYDWKITGLAIIFVPVAMILAESMKTVIFKRSRAFRAQMSVVTGKTYEIAIHAILLRTHGVLDKNIDRYNDQLIDLEKKAVKANALENGMAPIYLLIASLGVIFVIYMGGNRVVDGSWTIGTFTAYLGLFVALTVKASKSGKLFNSAQKASISWQRIKPYLTPMVALATAHITSSDASIAVSHLSFEFPHSAAHLVNDINFEAHKGQIIGITGPIACGKSTLGIALSDTIYNNVTLGADKDISELLKDIAFDTDLKHMPEQEQTLVGNAGVKLSGGQQARISLARALLHKNDIIILDDPFSAVDTLTETKIIENLKSHYHDSVILIISHRLTIFPRVDKVIMFDGVVKYGTHEEMLKLSPLYKSIYELQGGER
ncbi:MAG: ABC transporter ATP-binding protein, partial [Firmicutes bacterium]|nr:ABC transporter ATP-binding protein [Bacillota bacterium]